MRDLFWLGVSIMSTDKVSVHGSWASRWVFILAATGSAVGLGSIWKFPYMVGAYGGGAFVLVFLACIALIGIPVMIAETLIGRRSRLSPANALKTLAQEAGHSPRWSWGAFAGMITALLILSFYSVVGGWSLDYIIDMGRGDFQGVSPDQVGAYFGAVIADPWRLILWHTIFMLLSAVVIGKGVEAGLEKSLRIMMPMLFLLMLALLGYSLTTGHFMEGVHFMFDFNPEKVLDGLLPAMGHAFFSLSVGVGSIMVYGAYMTKGASISSTVVGIALLDTFVSLLAGLALFPIVFAAGLNPSEGPGLMFVTLPYAFGNVAFGQLMGIVFFVLVAVAAWSSAISLLEPMVAYLVERTRIRRAWVTFWLAFTCWFVGLGTVFSFNIWQKAKFFVNDGGAFHLYQWGASTGLDFFGVIDFFTSRIMLPLGGLCFVVFAGWVMGRETVRDELSIRSPLLFNLTYFLMRYVAPLGILVVFAAQLWK
ncbi:Na+-dependent transporters of the SNF family [Pseudomonas syringae pv. syringae HS191]|jgi:NSS family neurotransmitter:Na+ symporter|nr:Na+-dependent transporters of the SNF family [Pseudomonas syringae pv. syringae HS191]ALD97689.1 symporter [Pseudomonas syringae UMAF0158]EKG35488.1 sodium-dependent transporter [Pseudomonas syringae pv. avellanae str. ISPaVe013]EKG36088.1 sodium-dependent transporter [Pseudomonas syringae pv. avellanae str. ISPaVe037]ELS41363.1 SNF family Na+-dependent transporter [Pseudomonas syringae pv. syringae B64]EPF68243.1 SNF family Na+-dependent transporter [Pseudomonas syringae pv. syringae SM]K